MRKRDYDFDKYVSLNQNKYSNVNVPTKYNHAVPTDDAVATLDEILRNVKLIETVITAFINAVKTLFTSISTSVIPIVGWILAVALATGALIAITVIVVQYWDKICSVINDIKNWFIEKFSPFTDLINSYFDDAIAQGEESTVAERQTIAGKEITWVDANMTRDVAISIATDLRRDSNNVLLMKNISFPRTNEMNWWIPTEYVNVNFVIENKLCEAPYYFSTYTWYNSTAKQMLYESAPSYSNYGGYGYKNLVYDKFTSMTHAVYGWNHYHVGMYNPTTGEIKRYRPVKNSNGSELPCMHSVHSFFGLTYIRLPNDQGFVSYPANP